jgi:hypothetical protein
VLFLYIGNNTGKRILLQLQKKSRFVRWNKAAYHGKKRLEKIAKLRVASLSFAVSEFYIFSSIPQACPLVSQ